MAWASFSGWAKKAASALLAEEEMPWHSQLPPRTADDFVKLDDKITHQVILLSLQPEAFYKPIEGDAELFCDFVFNYDEWEEIWIPVCFNLDPRLQSTAERLIPNIVSEHDFWRNYASHIHLITKTILLLAKTEEERNGEVVKGKGKVEKKKITLPEDEDVFQQELEEFERQLSSILSSKEIEQVGDINEEEADKIFAEIEEQIS